MICPCGVHARVRESPAHVTRCVSYSLRCLEAPFLRPQLFTLALWSDAPRPTMVVFLLTVLVEGFAADQTSCLGPPHVLATFHGGSSSSDVNQVALGATLTLTHARLALILTAVLHATRLTGVHVHS